MSKTAWLTIVVTLTDDADLDEVVHNLDYKIRHEDIRDTEVMDASYDPC